MATFGNARRTGRPRSAEADAAILAATRTALVELGWGRLTMGDVAARAGVAKTTLYRRWSSKSELVVDAVAVLFDELRLTDRGSLRADVEDMVRQIGELLERPETKTALMAVMAESARDPALRLRIRDAIVGRQRHLVVQGRRRAQERGELPPDAPGARNCADRADCPGGAEAADCAGCGGAGGEGPGPGARAAARSTDLVFDVIAGAVVNRTLVSAEPVDEAWARAFTTLLLGGMADADRQIREQEGAGNAPRA
ncbi:TetR/AcrR family transcriptional regulator [Streptomyces thermolineatus]|uniref:TetR/AcrR family transcriptional regulator n=1 Tax=Streptomyces thermolineatus TaxID=44033 RepID=A0ABN3KYC7_9ACTN